LIIKANLHTEYTFQTLSLQNSKLFHFEQKINLNSLQFSRLMAPLLGGTPRTKTYPKV